VRTVESKSDGSVEFEFGAGEDARPQVAKAVVESGYELLEMRPIGLSLEEIFLELTRENSAEMKAA
jgi:ABC-2 type transport system ATP-binding protein